MRFVSLGTAGHVDHGKTTLVKALTGIDTDRLPEEKRRGMSIDFGFAFLDFPESNLRVELIDIPGHERFIKNAVAGLSCVKGVLLVVDASEGVMPQTVDHVRLMASFGIQHCIVVLTKTDKVDTEILSLARIEVEEFLKREGIHPKCILEVSALLGTGIDTLKLSIKEYATELLSLYEEETFFRLCVDSAFLVKGYGTVVRGSCVSGRIREGDTVVLEPAGVSSRIRRMQNHGAWVKEGKAGERLAVNLPEVDVKQVKRGDMLVKKGEAIKTRRLIAHVRGKLPEGVKTLFHWMREVKFRGRRVEESIYLLDLEEPVVAFVGDMGPILDSSGKLCGSYRVLHPLPIRRSSNFIRQNVDLLTNHLASYMLKEAGVKGVELKRISSAYGRHVNPQKLRAVRVGDKLYDPSVVENLKKRLRDILTKAEYPLHVEEVRSLLGIDQVLLQFLLEDTKGYRRVEGYILDETRSDINKLDVFKRLVEYMGDSIKEEKDLQEFRDILPVAVRRGVVHSLGAYLYVTDQTLHRMVEKLRGLGSSFSVQDAKTTLGLTRKYLIPLLEYLDRLGVTRREGDRRFFVR
ncbi:selenocysteine-specific translation elongation factor [Thermocrinis albus DSM 14484]|uniref:Selenocysteine-specific elongation factor n=1 Tax=Thermocrinis albus (strain DSM 14484 / JCM 11386 / HI 11/12) TaxID=638303 RepID=D3SQC7_THEAH|nr:selenocysteine-specific translation elongation factor [Thermocrinis albus]ADC89364.1 selenocysteine-specific translation elongation factor [Thermocrinis albus DSM 14484]